MCKSFFGVLLFVLLFSYKGLSQPPTHTEWDLVWKDEFNGVDADLDKGWNSFNGGYASNSINCSRWRRNATVSGGTLKMYYKKEKTSGGTGASAWSYDWTAASLSTKQKFKFGYFECRYKIVASKHTNNSFWLISDGSDTVNKRFEIDINEGQYSYNDKDTWKQIRTNVHNWTDIRADKSHPVSTYATNPVPWQDVSADFHVFGLEWNENELIWYFDGKIIRRSPNLNQSGSPVNCFSAAPVYLSAATLRSGMTNGVPVGDDLDGKFMEVDWVRVYQKGKETNLLSAVVGTPLSVITHPKIPDETTYSWEVSTYDPATNGYNPWKVLGNWGTGKTSTNGFGSTYDIRRGDTLLVTNFNKLMNNARFRCLLTSTISTANTIPSGAKAYASPYQRYSDVNTLMVNKVTPTVTWPAPVDIAYGTPLGTPQLNAFASVSGTFNYIPASATLLNAGNSQVLSLIFIPTDSLIYNVITKQVTINVSKATPVITWSNPTDIVYGTALSSSQLNAASTVDGTFAYTPAGGTKLNAGSSQNLSVTFTPTDGANYTSATKQVLINVSKATPTISWSNPADIVFGTALSPTQLNATSTVDGSFVYTPAGGTKLNAGSNQNLSVTFIPTDGANYTSATKQIIINVSKATPTISWSNPSDIVFGTALSPTQLNATSTIDGSFVYTPAGGTKLNVGSNQNLSVTFTPTDGTNYASATKQVAISVSKAQQQITFPALADKTIGDGAFNLTGSTNSLLPVSFASTSDKVAITNNQVTLLMAGHVSITASQIGNENYYVASSVTQSFCIKPAKPIITISNLNTPTPLLTSNASSGNQWYANGIALAGATNATLNVTKSGNYQVQVTVDDCTGEFSAEQPLVITGIEALQSSIDLFPIPLLIYLLYLSLVWKARNK